MHSSRGTPETATQSVTESGCVRASGREIDERGMKLLRCAKITSGRMLEHKASYAVGQPEWMDEWTACSQRLVHAGHTSVLIGKLQQRQVQGLMQCLTQQGVLNGSMHDTARSLRPHCSFGCAHKDTLLLTQKAPAPVRLPCSTTEAMPAGGEDKTGLPVERCSRNPEC